MNRSFGEAILIGGVSLFASWTLFCYALVFSDAGFSDLMKWCILPGTVGLYVGWVCIHKLAPIDGDGPDRLPDTKKNVLWRGVHAWSPLFLVAIITTLRLVDIPYWAFWVMLLLATILVYRLASTSDEEHNALLTLHDTKWQWAGFLALIALGATLAAITHRSDIDDSQYLNFVVTALDFPFEPLYSRSGLWLDQSVPLELPLYRFHSYELFVAALSHASGIDHKTIYYLVLPTIFGGIAILVHWRLAQHLVPGQALAFLLAWLVLIVALGESHRAFGNFAFVRLYQGKGLLVTVALPLCLLLGLRFAEVPDWRRGLALGLAAITSLGMSSSALVTVPLVVAAALFGGLLNASRTVVKRIVIGGLASLLVVVGAGAFLVSKMKIGSGIYGDILPSTSNGLSIVLGEGVLGAVVLALFPIAPLFVAGYRRRRIYGATTLLFVFAVLNPWGAPFLAESFDLALQWRLFWSVPLVLSASIALVGLTALVAKNLPRPVHQALLPVVLAALVLASDKLSISADNNVTIALPSYKVDLFDHSIASEIVHKAPLRSTVYTPVSIAVWITTFRQHPYPLFVRPDYFLFDSIQDHVGISELNRRRRVFDILEGHDEHVSTPAFFRDQLISDRPSFVAYPRDIDMATRIGAVLGEAGYYGEERGPYWLWQRK